MHYIDLFAGAGGLSEGFIRQGFEPIAHVEMSPYACDTLRTRIAFHHLRRMGLSSVYNSYLLGEITQNELYSNIPSDRLDTVLNNTISDGSIDNIFETVDQLMLAKTGQTSKVDLLIGGPPCQAYSLVGRARDPLGKREDPRNHLYKQYVKFLVKYNPDVFVFENVPGILSAANGEYFEDIKRMTNEVGYEIEARTLNAADFGVLQMRKRVILIGWAKSLNFEYPTFNKIVHDYKVQDLLSDLPALKPGGHATHYETAPTEYLTEYRIRDKDDVLTLHTTRGHNERDREIYRLAIEAWKFENKRLKYTDLPEELRTHNNLHSFLDRFKVVADTMPFSHTMVAHIAKDGHYYIHPDIDQLRSLSVREAARIQSFPDNYFFEGPRTAVFTQIGNAVPPLMASHIALGIRQTIENSSKNLISTAG